LGGLRHLVLDEEVRFGVRLNALTRAAALPEIRAAEVLGFDSLWVTDHLAFHVPLVDAMALLSFAAAVTERVTLGTSIYLLPLRSTLATAKQAASVDVLSEGRLVLGVGIGGEYPPEFAAAGVEVETRGARADETIPLLRRLWTEDDVAHDGRFERFPSLTLSPKPARLGGPPIWVGGRSPAAMRRAGRLGDGYISHMATPEHIGANLERIDAAAGEAGRGRVPFSVAGYFFTWIDDTVDAAAEGAAEHLERVYAMPFGENVRRYCLLGPPDAVRARLQAYVDAGLRHVIVAPLAREAEMIERFAREVRPGLTTRS